MYRLYAITILFFIGFSQSGYYLFSIGYRAYLREEMHEDLLHHADRKDLVCINYTEQAQHIKWEKKNKEFSFHDKMYDVAYADTVGNKILLYCADDEREAALLKQQNETEKHRDRPAEKKSITHSVKISDFSHEEYRIIIGIRSFLKSRPVITDKTLAAGKTEISLPPPETVS